jgi:hypothetical protein
MDRTCRGTANTRNADMTFQRGTAYLDCGYFLLHGPALQDGINPGL